VITAHRQTGKQSKRMSIRNLFFFLCVANIIRSPTKYPFNRNAPSWVNPKEYLPAQLQNIFELSYFTEGGSLVVSGMNSLNETSEYPKLSSRIPDSNISDDGVDSTTNGTVSNDEESQDELSQTSTDTPPTRMAEESEEEDQPPIVKVCQQQAITGKDADAVVC
jgi:hypothetical protein